MHDIIHVVAVLIAAEKHMFNITNAEKLKKEIEKIKQKGPTTISLSCKEDVYDLPEQLECPQLKFLLFTKGDSSGPIIPDLFFEGMKELQVLHLDHIDCVPSLPSSLGCLINLQTLCLENCELEDIAIVGQLTKLEILSFRDSKIQKLPLEIGQLTGLQLLDLSNCWRLQVIASNVISRLSLLEELYMMSFTRWEKDEGGENASLAELKGLSKLTTLEIRIPDAEIIPQDLVSVELERYRILIGYDEYKSSRLMHRWYDEYKSSRLMQFGGLGIHKMKMLLKGIEDLYLTELEGFPNVVHELDDNEGFPLLKHLHIENCFEILYIVSSVKLLHCQVFPMLESLYLYIFIACVRLKHLFTFSMTKNLLHLQEVEVSNCDKLEMIFGPNMEKPKTTLGIKEIIAEDDLYEKVIFPNLKKLTLESLPKLTSFVVRVKSSEFSMNISEENIHHLFHEKVGFPRLEVLMLGSMDKLRQIWHHQLASDSFIKLKKLDIYNCHGLTSIFLPMVNFPSLEELGVFYCGGLKYLFSYAMINNFPRLQRLRIVRCDSMEVIVGRDEGKLIEIVFPKLHYMEIDGCSNLRRFISTNSSEDNTQPFFDEKVNFTSLEELNVSNCGGLKYLFSYSVKVVVGSDKGKLIEIVFPKLHYLRIESCDNLRRFISTNSSEDNTQPFFDEKVALPNLMTLDVSGCDGLRSLMTLSTAESMVNLTTMNIRYCKKLEEIIQEPVEEEKVKENHMVFSQLQYLQLHHLPNMKTFSHGELRTPKLHKVSVIDGNFSYEECWEGDLNFTIQQLFKRRQTKRTSRNDLRGELPST